MALIKCTSRGGKHSWSRDQYNYVWCATCNKRYSQLRGDADIPQYVMIAEIYEEIVMSKKEPTVVIIDEYHAQAAKPEPPNSEATFTVVDRSNEPPTMPERLYELGVEIAMFTEAEQRIICIMTEAKRKERKHPLTIHVNVVETTPAGDVSRPFSFLLPLPSEQYSESPIRDFTHIAELGLSFVRNCMYRNRATINDLVTPKKPEGSR